MPRTITLNHITKIEGHAKLVLGIHRGKVTRCELSATEGSRYFEGLVIGRKYFEAHEVTSRICGICSCAHVICAIKAIEDALGYTPTEQTVMLRALLTLGERIRSHATHLYFLALPDYLGYESALSMASKYRNEIKTALNLMKIGNTIIKTLGARDMHPVSTAPGGWFKLPEQQCLDEIERELKNVKEDALKTCKLFSSLKYPKFKTECDWLSLRHKHYPVTDGEITAQNKSYDKAHYKEFLREYHEPRSTANFVVKEDHRYMVGALARLNNNYPKLSKNAKKMLKLSGIKLPSKNPFHNNIAQAIEIVQCIDQALDICNKLVISQKGIENTQLHFFA